MSTNFYKPGRWNALCDVCGFRFKSDELKKRWDGLMVCSADWEPDHPQKFLRVHEDSSSVPWVRDEPADQFVQTCSIWTATARADFGTADCMLADNATSIELLIDLFSPSTRAIAGIAIAGYAITGVS